MRKPSEYGYSAGGFKPTATEPITINLKNSGINTSLSPSQLEEGEAIDAIDVRFTKGGLLTDFAITEFGTAYSGVALKEVLGIANYQIQAGTRFLMRMRPTQWDRWNGTNWFTLSGLLTGTASSRYSSTTTENTFVAANLVDKLKAWNGLDATAVADLSADSPIAKFITKVGNRLLVAVIKTGANINYSGVAWSADGNIREWTDPNQGAGAADPPIEGGDDTPNWITGLSTIERGALIYRQRTLQLASLTGVGAAPFRFTTLDFSHGTESPWSIAKGGMVSGDYYLGYDYMPYHFDGQKATPIGLPIHESLRDSIPSLERVLGSVDRNEQEYYLASPDTNGVISSAWVFSIREYVRSKRLVWRRRTLPTNVTSLGYGSLVSSTDPLINSVAALINSVSGTIDSFGITSGPDRTLFGTNIGAIHRVDQSLFTSGNWISKVYAFNGLEVTLDTIRVKYQAAIQSVAIISISIDGGQTWTNPRLYNFSITSRGENYASNDFMVTGRQLQIRVQMVSGFAVIGQLECIIQPRGLGHA